MKEENKQLGLTKSGIRMIVVITLAATAGVFYLLYSAGTTINKLLELLAIGAVSLLYAIYVISLTLRVVKPRINLAENAPLYGRGPLILMRIFTVPCLVALLLMGYDLVMPPAKEATAIVLSKSRTIRGDPNLLVQENTKQLDREIGEKEFALLQPQDILYLKKSRFFGNWKEARVLRDGRAITVLRNTNDWSMVFVGVLFLSPFFSFIMHSKNPLFAFIRPYQLLLWIAIPVFEIVAIVISILPFIE